MLKQSLRILCATLLLATTATSITLKQPIESAELGIRAKYPQLFHAASTQAGSLSIRCSDIATGKNLSVESTDVTDSANQILSPREMKLFLMGGGQFKSPNGTIYEDTQFQPELSKRFEEVAAMDKHPVYNVARDFQGKKILQPTLEHRRDAKETSAPEDLTFFGPSTAIRWRDLSDLENELLQDITFDFVEFAGIRWDRKFLEATLEYEAALRD